LETIPPDKLILQVEKSWLRPLYEFVKTEFGKTWLPSHDHTHHLRVWAFAKDLVRTLHREGCSFSKAKLEQLIIAVFFHDTGLTRTLDASHGKESREISRSFLDRFKSLSMESRDSILEAVEKHDDKSCKAKVPPGNRLPDDILTILAVCDDMDAFGAIGVFRYLEIYAKRGIPLESIAGKVIANLESRFINLTKHYGQLKSFIQEQEKRYRYTLDFFRVMDEQVRHDPDLSSENGPVAVVNILLEKVLHHKIHFTRFPENPGSDDFGKKYFHDLQFDLSLSEKSRMI
jgi:HD domain